MQFKQDQGSWKKYRLVPGLVECDVRNEGLEDAELFETSVCLWGELCEAQEAGKRFVMFRHGGEVDCSALTSMRALVRAEMRADIFAELLVPSECVELEEAFVAAVRPLPAAKLLSVEEQVMLLDGSLARFPHVNGERDGEIEAGFFQPLLNHGIFELSRPNIDSAAHTQIYAAEAEVVSTLQRAQYLGLAYAVLLHGAEEDGANTVSMRTITRSTLEDRCTLDLLQPEACCAFDDCFAAALKPTIPAEVSVPLDDCRLAALGL